MTTITAGVATLLTDVGYDASPDWDAVGANPETAFVVVRAVAVVGWRYPNGKWFWEDRSAMLIDKGLDPGSRFSQPPYFDTAHRWEWLPSRPSAPEEHPCDTANAAELSEWVSARLPAPTTPICLLYHHPDDSELNRDLAYEMTEGPERTLWSWPPNWYEAWAEVDEPIMRH